MLYGGIKFRRNGLYDRDRAIIYFIYISILKLIKTLFKLYDKFKKDDGNDMTADVAQHERSNIKCYASAFSIIKIKMYLACCIPSKVILDQK